MSQAPAGFTAAIEAAASILEQTFTNNITINIRYGWGTWDNAPDGLIGVDSALGGPVADAFESYANVKSWLTAAATTPADLAAVASLPASTSAFPGGQSQFILSSAQEKALGQFTGSPTAIDGAIGFGTGWTDPTYWVGAALHEITHSMGRTTDFYADGPTVMDLFRFSAAGTYQWTGGHSAYLSTNDGQTKLADFSTILDYSDFAINGLNPNDPFDYSVGTNTLTPLDITTMNILGFSVAGPSPATLTGTLGNSGAANETASKPFAALKVGDPTAGATDTVTITLSNPAYGKLSTLGGGTYNSGTGVYTMSGTPGAVTTAIDALVLTPSPPAAGAYATSTSLTVGVVGPNGGPAAETAIAASVQQVLGLATVAANKIAISVSANGTGFAAPISGDANEAVITAPTAGASYTLPAGYQAAFLEGTANATLRDTSVGNAVLVGNAGNDLLISSAAGDTISAASTATAQITASGGNTEIFGGAGATSILDAGVHDTIVGAGGAMSVTVTSGAPLVYGGTGALSFSGGSGAATVVAGAGAATVFANAGGGQFWGGAGPMLFVGGSGVSTATGGSGSSTLFGGSSGHDLLVAGTGPSTVVGAGSGAVIVGLGAGNDVLVAGTGNETLVGSAGGGPDIMFAGTGSDALFAGTGNDTFVAAAGGAQMVGGAGHDVFSFTEGTAGGSTVIWNFTPGQDQVALFGYGTNAVANALATATVASGSTTITLPDNAQVTFANITNLQSSNFM